MNKEFPTSLRSFARRKGAGEERALAATQIESERRDRDRARKEAEDLRVRLAQIREELATVRERQEAIPYVPETEGRMHAFQIEALGDQIEAIDATLLGKADRRIRPLLWLFDLQVELTRVGKLISERDQHRASIVQGRERQAQRALLIEEEARLSREVRELTERIDSAEHLAGYHAKAARASLGTFYARQMEAWENMPATIEEMTPYFREEFLERLTMEQYAFLLRRFPSALVTHVTRQGVRDHTGHSFHTARVGEFHTGFTDITKDGRLRSVIGAWLRDGARQDALVRLLKLDEETLESALDELDRATNEDRQYGNGSLTFADAAAVHVATQEVAHEYYGAETGNEIFFCFPSAHIATQHHFCGQLNKAAGDEFNDQWVWSEQHDGLGINAGIVFLPKSADVDRVTGSRYRLDADKRPIVDEELVEQIKRLFDDSEFKAVMKRYHKASDMPAHERISKPAFLAMMSDRFGVTDDEILERLAQPFAAFMCSVGSDERFKIKWLRTIGRYYVASEDTVSSEAYWEAYFQKHPTERPARVFYYEGDPSAALGEWRAKYGLAPESRPRDLALDKRSIRPEAPPAVTGMEQFRALAEEAIRNYYANDSTREVA